MQTLKKKLPGLNGFITFEAAARHLSFTTAAHELCVSQAAVSRQIRRLETHLGALLFRRQHRSLQLTPQGTDLYHAVRFGLEHIAEAAAKLSQTPDHEALHQTLQVATTAAFASFWLMPRLNQFQRHYPTVDIRVIASDRAEDHAAAGVDIALTCGRSEPGQGEYYYLFSEQVFPVCAPEYLGSRTLKSPADLAHERLLHLDSKHWQDIGWSAIDWALWLKQFGVRYSLQHPALTFNHYPMLMQAAQDGQGIALGWRHLTEQLLASGRLICPLPQQWDSQRSYYLLLRSEPPVSAEVIALRDWLLQQAQVFNAASSVASVQQRHGYS